MWEWQHVVAIISSFTSYGYATYTSVLNRWSVCAMPPNRDHGPERKQKVACDALR